VIDTLTLDLDLIGATCKSLKWLSLMYIKSYKGTVNGLSGLKSVHVDSCFSSFPGASLIPMNSAASLTHLMLIFGYSEFQPENDCGDGAPDDFINLWSL
jgi:hypothetical protein